VIKVIQPGVHCSIQDRGRVGHARLGIPIAGSMDAQSAALGNKLLGNDADAAVTEITFGLGRFQFTKSCAFSLTGADFSATLDGRPLKPNQVYQAAARETMGFGKRQFGARVYLSVAAGIRSNLVLGSRSYFPGMTPNRLESGDCLPIQESSADPFDTQLQPAIEHQEFLSASLECTPGPEFRLLNLEQQTRLFRSFSVSVDNNRVGYRLVESLNNELEPILTSAVLPGTVQLTPDGTLIILMRDAPVTGGYPRVLQLSESAICRVSQKIARDPIRFQLKRN